MPSKPVSHRWVEQPRPEMPSFVQNRSLDVPEPSSGSLRRAEQTLKRHDAITTSHQGRLFVRQLEEQSRAQRVKD